MSSGNIAFPEWLNANSLRAYPISETTPRTSVNGEITLPNTLIVDARVNAPYGHMSGVFYISSVEVLQERVSVDISYYGDGESSAVATVIADVATHIPNKSYPFVGNGDNHSVLGVIVIGELGDIISSIQGSYDFAEDSTPLEPATINVSQPMIEYVSLVVQGVEVGKLDRVVKLRAGSNIRLTRVDSETIRIDGISGENLDDCPEEPSSPPILTINGAPPDDDGNFLLTGSECIQVFAKGTHSLEIRDLCSSSCCGCQELNALTSSLGALETQQITLRELIYQAYNDHSNMIASLTSFLRP